MKTEENWIEIALKLHEQSHLYWRTIFAIHLLVVGWGVTLTNIKPLFAWLIVCFVILIQTLLTQAMMKLYTLLIAAMQEYKNKHSESSNTPFLLTINKTFLLKPWQLALVNFILTTAPISILICKAYITI